MPQEVGADSLGPYRREPAYPRRALCGGRTRHQNLQLVGAGRGEKPDGGKRSAQQSVLADGREICAALAIAADGRESPLRAQMGIKLVGWSYPQTGIVATVGA